MIWLALLLSTVAFVLIARRQQLPAQRLVGLAVAVAGAITMVLGFIVAIPAGHVGVPVLFGRVQDRVLTEGLNLVNPFVTVQEMTVRTETYTMSAISTEGQMSGDDAIIALSSDGLRMPLDVTVAYRLNPADAPWVYRNLGRDFVGSIIRPAARTAVREGTSAFTSQEAYATKRDELATRMQELLVDRLAALLGEYEDFTGTGFRIQQVMLRNVDLPPKVKAAIEEKLSAEQDALRMQFVLEKERQEAERKRIEGRGIADFQQIVSEGISEPLLRWKGIEATLEIARSDNAKVVIVGAGEDGLPVILNPS